MRWVACIEVIVCDVRLAMPQLGQKAPYFIWRSPEEIQVSDGPTPAVQLSPEFLAGSTEAGLEKIRTRLLDLTSRNRLLNFRHSSASSLRVVGVDPNIIFRRLTEGEKLVFLPVPEPDRNVEPKPSAVDHAKAIEWPTSFDLDDVAEVADDTTLPVLHYVEHLETLTRKIGSAAKTAIEESGANMLYLILGFLEWYESDDSEQPRFAPLLTVPVTLDRSAGRGAAFQCAIEHSGEDLATNLSLVERMRRDFGLEIPALDNDDTPEEYFARFGPIFPQKRRWRIQAPGNPNAAQLRQTPHVPGFGPEHVARDY